MDSTHSCCAFWSNILSLQTHRKVTSKCIGKDRIFLHLCPLPSCQLYLGKVPLGLLSRMWLFIGTINTYLKTQKKKNHKKPDTIPACWTNTQSHSLPLPQSVNGILDSVWVDQNPSNVFQRLLSRANARYWPQISPPNWESITDYWLARTGARLPKTGTWVGTADLCHQHLEAATWQLLLLFGFKSQTPPWTCKTEGEICNEPDRGTEVFFTFKCSISPLNHTTPKWRTSKVPSKGNTMGVNFIDGEKPKYAHFYYSGVTCYQPDLPVAPSRPQVLSSEESVRSTELLFTWGKRKNGIMRDTETIETDITDTNSLTNSVSAKILLKVFLSADHWWRLQSINSDEKPAHKRWKGNH